MNHGIARRHYRIVVLAVSVETAPMTKIGRNTSHTGLQALPVLLPTAFHYILKNVAKG